MAADDLRQPDAHDGPQPFAPGQGAQDNAAPPKTDAPDAQPQLELDDLSDEELQDLFGEDADLTSEADSEPPRERDTGTQDTVPPESGFTQEQWANFTTEQRGGWLRRSDYDRKLTDRRRGEEQLDYMRGQLEAKIEEAQKAIDRANALPQQPPQQEPAPSVPDVNDYLDDDGGFDRRRFSEDVNKALKEIARQVAAEEIKPVRERLEQSDQAAHTAAEQVEFARLDRQKIALQKAIPLAADPRVFDGMLAHMERTQKPGSYDLRVAFMALHPLEWGRFVARQEQAQRQQQAGAGAPAGAPPRTPAGHQRRETSDVPDQHKDPEGFEEALAQELQRML